MPTAKERVVRISADSATLAGSLVIPKGAKGIVLFAHGSGSGRHSPRNQFVARELQQAGLATLLLDLLTIEEAEDRECVFDIELLADRLHAACQWLVGKRATREMKVGLFGASTGGGAALVAAARHPEEIHAVVSRGGRPDLAENAIPDVAAPTLLIVGEKDDFVVQLNGQAFNQLTCEKEMVIVAGATHLFPEVGALEEVARLATEWFQRFLASRT